MKEALQRTDGSIDEGNSTELVKIENE